MSGTQWVPLLEAVQDVSRGNRKIPQSEFEPSGPLPVVDQGQGVVAGYTHDEDAQVSTDPPVIVFGDHTRALKFVDFPFAMGADGVKVLKPTSHFEPRFVYHYLLSCRLPNAGYSRHFKFLREVKVPMPGLAEQRRIAAILDQADAIRTKRREALAHLDTLTQSIFHDMFGGITETLPLGEMCTFYSGSTPPRADKSLWGGDLPWFSPKDFKQPDLYDSIEHVSDDAPVRSRLRVLPPDTVAVVVRGMILAHTLPVSVLQRAGTINQDVKAVLPREGLLSSFLAAALKSRSRWILDRVATSAHGTKKIDGRTLESIPIPRVTVGAQTEFATRVSGIDTMTRRTARGLAYDEEVFASLQSRAFRGEL